MLSYADALRAIFRRTDYERGDRPERPAYAERVWRLDRVRELLSALGNPHHAYRAVHVAGTKGKGSTTAMIESALRAAGYRTGMYTSPHLHTFRERIRRDGEPIPEEDVARLVERMQPVLAERPEVTVFEIITALAMLYLSEEPVDIGVFEVGLGGRLDATNVLVPEVSVITSISLDHTKILGDTLEAIAGEKAGIIKPGVPVVTAPQQAAALGVIEAKATAQGAPLTVVGRDWRWRALDSDLSGQHLAVFRAGHEESPEYDRLYLPLLGAHQLENAATAVAALEVLREGGMDLPQEAVRCGLAEVVWPGRLEVLSARPLVVVDGAHNPYSMERLLEAVGDHLRYERLILVFGSGTTHPPADLLRVLLPAADEVLLVHSRHAKATPVGDLAAYADSLGHPGRPAGTVAEGLTAALEEAGPEDLVLVTGSLFVVAEAREAWACLCGLPTPPSDPPDVY
ncbi:MAG: bifunctional folylpolyglutamate synthase/dihydrofolate synthase [Chloroflexi bacterium]|nr:bifunctional folylpolyglutamate synthase/dihydrofolate synthase [Chloroflexota bacterium]